VTISRVIFAALILFVLLVLIDWRYVNEHSERIRFITVNSLSLLVVVIIAIQAVIYRREWRVMQKGLRQTDRMIDKMHEQLDAMKEQAAVMTAQVEIAGKAIAVAERDAEAAEKSVALAQEALDVEQAPYFGITNIEIQGLGVAHCPQIEITFMNGGRTPAWSFYAIALVFVGYRPDLVAEKFSIEPELGNWGDTFVPSGKAKTICFTETDFRLTEEQDKAIRSDHPQRFFIQGTAHYRNMKGKKLWTEFCGVYYPSTGRFGDYYAT
jgi:ABC-type multidrug transport system fused ATPase/permease subunit